MTAPKLSIVVFAYNEAENVAAVLRELARWLEAHEPHAQIVFVDDGSADGTAAVAERVLLGRRDLHDRVIRHATNRGIGAALKTGVSMATADWVTFMPADGQVPPEAIGALREAARRHTADLVLSVYAGRDDGLGRKLLSWGVRSLIRAVHGVRLYSDGPYLFRRHLFDPALLPPDSFFLNFEFPIRMLRAGVTAATVTIACRPRRAGRSKSAKLGTVALIARDLLVMRLRG